MKPIEFSCVLILLALSLSINSISLASSELSQNPAPGPSKPSHSEQKQSTARKQLPPTYQRGTEDTPVFIKGEITTQKTKEGTAGDAEERKEKSSLDRNLVVYTGLATLFTFGLMLAATIQIGMFWRQLSLLKEEISETRKVALYTLRPRLRVRRIAIENNTIRYVIANVGNTPARLTGGRASMQYRKREFGLPNLPGPIDQVNLAERIIEPGVQISLHIQEERDAIQQAEFEAPFEIHATSTLYFYGWIRYSDDLGNVRETSFCRQYDGTKFMPVDNLDYEYED